MKQFKHHNVEITKAIEGIIDSHNSDQISKFIDLDEIDLIARRLLTPEEMKTAGSFFTGQKLSTKLVQSIKETINEKSLILDPTCGTGNLLIEASRLLTIDRSLKSTLKKWGNQLAGHDTNPSFIDTTKLRIILEAISRGAKKDCSIHDAMMFLSKITTKDTLTTTPEELKKVTHLLMNPPFSNIKLYNKDFFSNGTTNAASVILVHYLRNIGKECYISAILPDVIRSGSRYEKVRNFCDEKISGTCSIWGRFNKKTNVDVFLLTGRKSNSYQAIKWFEDINKEQTIGSRYVVKIGPLVSYRDDEKGVLAPYLHQKNCPQGQTVTAITEKRKFHGKLYTPPFVVIKRTSSPKDSPRASSTLVLGDQPIAVENHMIIIKPISECIDECFRLLSILQEKSTDDFLNDRIRLRHLTVKAIKEIPL